MNSKKKRRDDWRRDFSDFFALDEIDDEFERMREYMDRIMHRLMEGELEYEKPFVYGFSMKVGPDGKPQIQQFGNTKPWTVGREEEIGGREPLTDIIEGGKTISVTIEIPGVEKDDIELDTTENMLTISVDAPQRRYYKEVELPSKVNPELTKATYKNGVLDIVLEKVVKKDKKGKKIPIG